MLLGNFSVLHKSPGRFLAGTVASNLRDNFSKPGMCRGRWTSDMGRTFDLLASRPGGYSPGNGAWVPARKGGGMSSFLNSRLVISASGGGALGRALEGATAITITTVATGQLIASAIGSSTVSITTNTPLLTASLNGSGSTTFTISTNTPLLGAKASMVGSATYNITAFLTPYATGAMAGLAKLAGDVTTLNDYGGSIYLSEDGTDGVEYPAGVATFPVKTMANANFLATKYGLKNYYIRGSYTLEQTHSNTTFYGVGPQQFSKLALDNQLLDGVLFRGLTIEGQLNTPTVGGLGWQASRAKVEFHDSYLHEIIDLQGNLVNCTIDGPTSIKAGGWVSGSQVVIEGDFTVFDMQSTTGTTVSMDIESGWSQFANAVTGCLIELNVKGGEVSFAASCTGGEYYLEGVGTLFNDGAMTEKENHFIWDEKLDGAYTATQIQRLTSSALAGKVSGSGTNAPAFRDLGDTKNRITATTDTDGNRLSITLDAT